MQKTKGWVVLSLLMCFCFILFSGCSYSLNYNDKITRYNSINYGAIDQFSVIEEEELVDLSSEEKAQLIAERYISISFTVLIYKVNQSTSVEEQYSFGSGFIVYTGGYILTNFHVIDVLTTEVTPTAGYYYKCYVSQDGGSNIFEANLLWYNSSFDMAILICEEFDDLGAANLKDRTLFCDDADRINILEKVITVGTQSSLDGYASATTGEITSTVLRDSYSTDGAVYEYLIQHDAPINHGNSGGALIDMDGNVIGLNTLGDDNSNLLFYAVSIYPVIAVLDKVVENYEDDQSITNEIIFGFVGADKFYVKYKQDLMDLSSSYSYLSSINFTGDGVYVYSVDTNCKVSGLQPGDIVVGINVIIENETITFQTNDRFTLLCGRIWLLYAQEGSLKVLRGENEIILPLTLQQI
jgi:S1-C subfamily serine protease